MEDGSEPQQPNATLLIGDNAHGREAADLLVAAVARLDEQRDDDGVPVQPGVDR